MTCNFRVPSYSILDNLIVSFLEIAPLSLLSGLYYDSWWTADTFQVNNWIFRSEGPSFICKFLRVSRTTSCGLLFGLIVPLQSRLQACPSEDSALSSGHQDESKITIRICCRLYQPIQGLLSFSSLALQRSCFAEFLIIWTSLLRISVLFWIQENHSYSLLSIRQAGLLLCFIPCKIRCIFMPSFDRLAKQSQNQSLPILSGEDQSIA